MLEKGKRSEEQPIDKPLFLLAAKHTWLFIWLLLPERSERVHSGLDQN